MVARQSHGLGVFLYVAVVVCGCGCASAAAQRMVFAHYLLANQDYAAEDPTGERKIAAYEREIREAQAIGIDGFALNAGGWFKEPRYIRRASEMFEAPYRLHSGFQLMFSADMCCSNTAEDVKDMVRRFANSNRYAAVYAKQNGRPVLTTFAGEKYGPAFWRGIRRDLEHGSGSPGRDAPGALAYVSGVPSSAPLPIEFVPAFFWGGELPTAEDVETNLAAYADIVDGAFYWGIAGVPGRGRAPDQIPSSESYAAVLHRAGKLYMAPVCLQFWGANAGRYYEFSGFSGMRALWMDAINVTHPEWIELITWNDFIEGTYVSPIDDPARYEQANDLAGGAAPSSTRHFYPSHRGAAELLPFFIAWYKTGRKPAIRQDSVFWAYRTQLAPHAKAGGKPVKLYGRVANVVYLTANLSAPALLRVSFGNHSTTMRLPAGSNDVQAPMRIGNRPRFELSRGSSRLARASGDDPIRAVGPYPNLYYSTGSMHD